MKYNLSIEKDDINLLPIMDWSGEIIEIETPEGALRALDLLSREKMVGFDTETRPSYTRGIIYTPALLQLATNDHAYIFRLKFFDIPKELIDFLSNPNIQKIGVGIPDDLHGLKMIMNFKPDGFVDLSKEVRKRGFQNEGLRALTAIFLGKRLTKGAKHTNWEMIELPRPALKYAAFDAVVGLLIYEKILEADSNQP